MKLFNEEKRKEKAKARAEKREQRMRKPLDKLVRSRIGIMAIVIVAMFSVILGRLVYLQAFEHEAYLEKQDDYTSIHQYTMAPRGQIYDCNGNVIAKTVVSHNIVYSSPNNLSIDDYLVYARRIAAVFEVDEEDFTDWELKDAYLTYCNLLDSSEEEYQGLFLLDDSELEAYYNGDWGSDASTKLYSTIMSHMTVEDAHNLSDEDLLTYAIYNRMLSNYSTGQESVILEDVSDRDVAYLVEHKTEFPGFDVDFDGWKREYPYGESLSDVIGSVSTSTSGLPDTYQDYYLAKGYQYNAQVGTSGLELQYNDILAGTEEIAKITYDSNGLAHKEIIQEAVKGRDIYLSIDMEVQQVLDDTLKSVLETNAGTSGRENFSTLFMCMMNPQTGDVIAMSGYEKNLETGVISYYAAGNYKSLINPGSCVKGATVYMGESEGVVTPDDEYINDVRMNIGGQSFGSFADHGYVNDISALSVSSNVYMFNIAIRLGGDEYVEGESLNIEDPKATLELMRNYYSQFGLGNATGIDLPGEISAYLGTSELPGMLLNYSIGQYDTYTPLQILQYVSVIAADGKMFQPKVYAYSKEVNGDEIYDLNAPTLKNVLPEENMEYLERVQEGFRACVADGNCYNGLTLVGADMAAKTGTAEVGEWTTSNLVGYGPYEDPTVAFACTAPLSSVNSSSVGVNLCANDVVQPVLTKYFELYSNVDSGSSIEDLYTYGY